MSVSTLIVTVVVLVGWSFMICLRPLYRAKQSHPDHDSPSSAGSQRDGSNIPISVNYHFTRQCNLSCGFCFHTATTSYVLPIKDAMRGIALLKKAGMRKINFAGGEPFLHPKFLSRLLHYCKEIEVESVSIVSNGSKVTEAFLERHCREIDILAISCDSFEEETNSRIGRGTGSNVQQLYRVKAWCDKYAIRFKLNTVVCHLNWTEDMNKHISTLSPYRWKCFQVLVVEGENDSKGRLRDATKFTVSSAEFEHFIKNHQGQESLIAEPNRLMAKSYLILDEYMRFLDRTGRQPSRSILEIGVRDALISVFWDVQGFYERGGLYDWRAHRDTRACTNEHNSKLLQW